VDAGDQNEDGVGSPERDLSKLETQLIDDLTRKLMFVVHREKYVVVFNFFREEIPDVSYPILKAILQCYCKTISEQLA